jgi:hypothetical protein
VGRAYGETRYADHLTPAHACASVLGQIPRTRDAQ